jgi:uncharacterized transporter YbjL
MNTSNKIAVTLFVLGIVVGLVQLWFAPWSPPFFIKLELTLAAFLVVALVLGFLANENKASKALRRGDQAD